MTQLWSSYGTTSAVKDGMNIIYGGICMVVGLMIIISDRSRRHSVPKIDQPLSREWLANHCYAAGKEAQQ